MTFTQISWIIVRTVKHQLNDMMSDDVKASFEHKLKVGVILVDLTAGHDSVWLQGLHMKLLHMISEHHTVSFLMKLFTK